ncbi:MAG: FliM/FliN family flagellar motor switch protein [Pseudomonadota bacterium]
MSDDVLTAEEIDALLSGLRSGNIALQAPAAFSGTVEELDLTAGDPIVRSDMPSLGHIDQLFARYLQKDLRELLNEGVTAEPAEAGTQKFREYAASLPVPTSMNLVFVEDDGASMMIVLSQELIASFVDFYFGGSARGLEADPKEEFSPTELGIVTRLLHLAFDNLGRAWAGVMPLRLRLSRQENHPQFCSFFSDTEPVHISRTDIELSEDLVVQIATVLPVSMLEPLREALESSARGSQEDQREAWRAAFRQSMGDAGIDLNVDIAGTRLPLAALMRLQPGDVMPVEMFEQVTLCAGGVPLLQGQFGIKNGRNAIQIRGRADA